MPDFERTETRKGERECMKVCWLPALVGDTQCVFAYKAVVGHTALKYGVALYVTPKKDFGCQMSRKKVLLLSHSGAWYLHTRVFTISLAGSLDYFWDIQHNSIYILLARQ